MTSRARRSDAADIVTIRRAEARSTISAAISVEGLRDCHANDVISTARDLHILVEQDTRELSFSHRIVQELFAAVGLDIAESLNLLGSRFARGHSYYVSPRSVNRSSRSEQGLEGLAYSLAEIKGEDFTERLADVDPLLAAHAHAAARFSFKSPTGESIRVALLQALQRHPSPLERILTLRALAIAEWLPPVFGSGTGTVGLHRIPSGEWRLGRNIEATYLSVEKIAPKY